MASERRKKIGIIIQARMGSTRLPGKVLMKLDDNLTVLDILIKRLKFSKLVNEIIIATTPDDKNKSIIDAASIHNISYFIGSEDNVLERYYQAANQFNLDIIIRITSDCPFIDPNILDEMVVFYMNNNYDYIKNVDESTNFPRGLDIEIFNFSILEKVYKLASKPPEKEHVTYYLNTHPKDFSIFIYNNKELKKKEGLRLTIDEENDFLMCRTIYRKLQEKGKDLRFTIIDILEVIEENPEFIEINKGVKQKKV